MTVPTTSWHTCIFTYNITGEIQCDVPLVEEKVDDAQVKIQVLSNQVSEMQQALNAIYNCKLVLLTQKQTKHFYFSSKQQNHIQFQCNTHFCSLYKSQNVFGNDLQLKY